jgi:glycosyltransferase involved in cell wall biosynthesis
MHNPPMSRPIVSVAIPLYNKAAFIAETVASALAQTFSNFEIVVVDDGSTDDGLTMLRQFSDPRIVSIRQDNAGVAVARTRAIREAQGTFVAFLDADDIWHSDHLSHLMELCRLYPQAAIFGNDFAESSIIGTQNNIAGRTQYRIVEDYFSECAFGRAPFYTSSCMVWRQRALDLGGFPIGKYCGEDLALWMKLAACAPVAVSNYLGCCYRRGIESLSRQSSYRNAADISMSTLMDLLKQHDDWSDDRKQSVREYYFRIALAHCLDCLRAGELDQAKEFLRLSSGTRMLRRRLWEAKILAYAPEQIRRLFFLLLDHKQALAQSGSISS